LCSIGCRWEGHAQPGGIGGVKVNPVETIRYINLDKVGWAIAWIGFHQALEKAL
jgi:hypothetical protein